ncbi:LOW QUALITY PROTEIN: trans-1,2-dihydrobenzene-1,2-diol dehydrogenase-like [Narcine bancroftii]|uniref:LOW QUALITY PROTEIN: trans-1,2-dihydrobenzene-1,2-diol dehydrogenase-like n=1 Tax=Narcine bancroftii TaxID=1343680 RepID=UPI0038315157
MVTRWGICSAGRICHDFMVALKTLPTEDHQAVAVASRDPSRARDFAERHEIPKSYGSYEELAKDPNKLLDIFSGSNQKLLLINSSEKSLNILSLGGGVLLDVGCYCLQFVCMVYNGEKPESIHASGFLTEKGVDETVTIILKYSRKRMAMVTVTMANQLPNQAIISGVNGTITVPGYMWCPTSLVVNGNVEEFPLPAPSQPLNFTNSLGLRYEAEEVRQCLQKGLKECPQLTLADSELIMTMMDEVRRQVGVIYTQDTC